MNVMCGCYTYVPFGDICRAFDRGVKPVNDEPPIRMGSVAPSPVTSGVNFLVNLLASSTANRVGPSPRYPCVTLSHHPSDILLLSSQRQLLLSPLWHPHLTSMVYLYYVSSKWHFVLPVTQGGWSDPSLIPSHYYATSSLSFGTN